MDNPKSIDIQELLKQREQLVASIAADEKRYLEVIEEAAELKRLHEAKLAELNELKRYDWRNPGGSGRIADRKLELARVEQAIADESKPLVYWSMYGGTVCRESTATPTSWGHTCLPYVVDKVTKKRIFVRKKGDDRQVQFDHEGANVSRYQRDRIDLTKTFPQGIKPS